MRPSQLGADHYVLLTYHDLLLFRVGRIESLRFASRIALSKRSSVDMCLWSMLTSHPGRRPAPTDASFFKQKTKPAPQYRVFIICRICCSFTDGTKTVIVLQKRHPSVSLSKEQNAAFTAWGFRGLLTKDIRQCGEQ